MTTGPLRTVVADTSALVSLAVPRAVENSDPDPGFDPLQTLLTSVEVSIPPAVKSELRELSQYQDIHGAAATNVLAAHEFYRVSDPYSDAEISTARPTLGLDDGETDAIVLANSESVDGFLTDEFGGTNFALVHASLRGPRLISTPRLIVDYARNGHLGADDARMAIELIGAHRSWGNSAYVMQLLTQLESNG